MTLSTTLAITLAALATAAGGGVAVLVVTTSGPFADSDNQQAAGTTSPVASATAAATPPAASPTPPGTAIPTKTYTQPASRQSAEFSFQYPATWFVSGGAVHDDGIGLTLSISSWDRADPRYSSSPDIPKGEVKVNISVHPSALDPCPTTGQRVAPVGNMSGWEIVRVSPFAEPIEQTLSRMVFICVTRGTFTYSIGGYFTAEVPDESAFRILVRTFEVK